MTSPSGQERDDLERRLIANIRAALPDLQEHLRGVSDHWGYEDPVYRFYHQSFKVYGIQATTLALVERFEQLLPGRPLNERFREIIAEGTGKVFEPSHNRRWSIETRPLLEAFFHARYFLEMICKYGSDLEEPPTTLPSGWAAVLHLYDLR